MENLKVIFNQKQPTRSPLLCESVVAFFSLLLMAGLWLFAYIAY